LEIEKKLIEFALDAKYNEIPRQTVNTAKTIILTNLGSIIAGASEESCRNLVSLIKDWGGKPESTILVYGDRVPGYNAALANSTIARSLDYEDAVVPGLHMGPVAFPAALASAEIVGGCTGEEFLTSLVAGIEVANRINLVNLKAFYGGFKGTGVCSIFAATIAAGRILKIKQGQMLNACGVALNMAAGSVQSNNDGAQAVQLVAGFASQSGVLCSQMAQKGLTGPKNFIEGTFGWLTMFGRDKLNPEVVVGELGKRFELNKTLFKKFPSCGVTQTSTQGILEIIQENGLNDQDVENIEIRVGPFAYTATGHFKIGNSPRVNAQFSIPYCVANALLRKSSRLQHFEEAYIRDPRILEIVKKIQITPDPVVEARSQRGMEMKVLTKEGKVYQKQIDIPRGSPENEMSTEEQIARYLDCASYGKIPLSEENVNRMIPLVDNLEELNDIRRIIPLLISLHNI